MKKNQKKEDVSAQGAETPKPKSYDVDTIKKYLNHDLSMAISCLNAIQSDLDLLHQLAVFMKGRFDNSVNAKIQKELFENENKEN